MTIKRNAFALCIFLMLILFSFTPTQANNNSILIKREESDTHIIQENRESETVETNIIFKHDINLDVVQERGVPHA